MLFQMESPKIPPFEKLIIINELILSINRPAAEMALGLSTIAL